MEDSGAVDEQLRVLSFWRMVELFNELFNYRWANGNRYIGSSAYHH